MKRIVIFTSGDEKGGGSGFRKLAESSLTGILNAEIAAVVSNHPGGGVKKTADIFGINFVYFPGPWGKDGYQRIIEKYNPDLVALSGWIKRVKGLDPKKTINIHPGPLPDFGGKGMHGHNVHERIYEAYTWGDIKCSAVSMHFVTAKYDAGPIFFSYPVLIGPEYDAARIGLEVNKIEHGWQSYITNLVLEGKIYWDGLNPESLVVPEYVPRIRVMPKKRV